MLYILPLEHPLKIHNFHLLLLLFPFRPYHSTCGHSPASHLCGPGSSHVRSCGICGGKVALGQVLSLYFSFPCHHHLSSGNGTLGQLVAGVPSALNLTPHKKKISLINAPKARYELHSREESFIHPAQQVCSVQHCSTSVLFMHLSLKNQAQY
jgi:hypothetical protein